MEDSRVSARQIRADMDRLRGTVRARSSITGRFRSLRWALTHPRRAVLERLHCRAALDYPAGPTIRCELPKGHPGTHLAGAQSWST
jgi:hypothetical protein